MLPKLRKSWHTLKSSYSGAGIWSWFTCLCRFLWRTLGEGGGERERERPFERKFLGIYHDDTGMKTGFRWIWMDLAWHGLLCTVSSLTSVCALELGNNVLEMVNVISWPWIREIRQTGHGRSSIELYWAFGCSSSILTMAWTAVLLRALRRAVRVTVPKMPRRWKYVLQLHLLW